MKKKLWSIDAKWGAGGLVTNCDDIVIESPPIFRKFVGTNVHWLKKSYDIEFIKIIKAEETMDDFF